MSWTVRRQGSPASIEGLTPDQIDHGLEEGRFGPVDLVRGPGESEWLTLENHPRFAETAAEIEEDPVHHYDEETHLDMTALIDVTLVLLIFFIIIASYAVIQKRLEAPKLTADGAGPAVVTEEQVSKSMIHVKLTMENDKPIYRVEGKALDPANLQNELSQYVAPGKTQLLLEHDSTAPHGAVVRVQDAAKGAGMTRVYLLIPEDELPPSD